MFVNILNGYKKRIQAVKNASRFVLLIGATKCSFPCGTFFAMSAINRTERR